jgi:hypothetical protein
MTYDSGYPTKPIGGSNPYYCCAHCGISDPQINGELNNHADTCVYRQQKQGYVLDGNDAFTFTDELYNEELEIYTVVRMAQEDLENRNVKGALARLKVDADKIRPLSPKLYAIIMKQP